VGLFHRKKSTIVIIVADIDVTTTGVILSNTNTFSCRVALYANTNRITTTITTGPN